MLLTSAINMLVSAKVVYICKKDYASNPLVLAFPPKFRYSICFELACLVCVLVRNKVINSYYRVTAERLKKSCS